MSESPVLPPDLVTPPEAQQPRQLRFPETPEYREHTLHLVDAAAPSSPAFGRALERTVGETTQDQNNVLRGILFGDGSVVWSTDAPNHERIIQESQQNMQRQGYRGRFELNKQGKGLFLESRIVNPGDIDGAKRLALFLRESTARNLVVRPNKILFELHMEQGDNEHPIKVRPYVDNLSEATPEAISNAFSAKS